MIMNCFDCFLVTEELEESPSGLDEDTARRHVFQVRPSSNWISKSTFALLPGSQSH